MMRPEASLLRRPIAEAMEERILHSADLSPLQYAPLAAGDEIGAYETTLAVESASVRESREIVFIDAGLSGVESLLLDLQTQARAGRPLEIVLIDAGQDGITLISSTLAGRSDIGAVHLLAHGGDGLLQLGSARLDELSLLQRAGEIAGWGDALGADADLMLYGCDVAGSELGRAFARELSQLTGADVAASDDLTGAAALGGNWTLEFETGVIESAGIASGWMASNWHGVLATYVADPGKSDGSTGSLRWAIDQANANAGTDTIQLLAGTYTLTTFGANDNFNFTGDLDIRSDIVFVGATANPADTVIRSAVSDRVMDVVSGSVSLSNLTLTGGSGGQQGGALSTSNFTSATLSNVVLSGNSGSNGGAIYSFGSLTMDRVRVTGNTSTLTGGGVTVRGTTSMTDVEISGNTAATSGGGLYMQSAAADVTLNRVTISGNSAASGAGIYATNGSLNATNTTLSGNTASGVGGGIFINVGSHSFTDSTIANNAGASGGGIGGPAAASLRNTILASNTGGNASVAQVSNGWNIDTDGSAIANGGTDRVVSTAALKLGALGANGGFTQTHALLNGSVAIDTGNPGASATDQRGNLRVGTADVGAFEADGKLIVTTTADVVDGATGSIAALLANMGADGKISLREAIIAANNTLGADQINLPAGNYLLSLSGNDNTAAAGDLDITDALTIIGAGAQTTTVNGGAIDRVFDIRGAAATISGVTLLNGSTGGDGGAINISGGGAALTLRDAAISGSSAGSGGAIYLGGTLVLDRVTIDGNSSTGGTGTSGGGGIYVAAGSNATLTNVTLTGNSANRDGGAINSRGTVTLINSTVAANSASGGGGIDRAGGTVSLLNTILANNTGGNSTGALTSLGYNIDSANTAGLTGPGDRINTNPLLGTLQYNGGGNLKTMAIGAGSAAIDGGTASGAPTLDARGYFRISNDIGAYERNSLVVDTTDDVVDGSTTSIDALLANRGFDGRISLREAVIASNNTTGVGDIDLPAGTYTLRIGGTSEDFAASGDLDLRDSLRIRGAGAATTVISGGGTMAVMQVISGSSSLSGLTIADGYSTSSAAGLQVNAGATLVMSQSVVRNNNSFENGTGITNAGNLTLTDVEVRDNSGSKDGGGILNTAGSLTLNRVTIAGNSAAKGAGLHSEGGTVSLTNVTVSGNVAFGKGGGVNINGGSAALLNVTIANNQASSSGGGGIDFDTSLPAGSVTLRNVLLADNLNGNLGKDDSNSAALVSLGNNLSASNSPELSHASDRKNAIANLGTLGNWGGSTRTRPLLSGSAAINNGDSASAPATDQRGAARVGTADIGAYEFSGAANSAPVLDAAKSPVLASIAANAPAPVGAVGTLVSALVDATVPAGGLDNVSDADAGALLGIAVVGIDTTNGSAWWSIDDGASWTAFGSVTPASARLLAADSQTRVYFQPNPAFSGTLGSALTIRAWDRSGGVNGGTGDSTLNGGATAYSTATDTVSLLVIANAAPLVSTSGGTLAYTENQAATAIDPALTVSDADSANLSGATVSITANYANGQDVLSFTDQLGISGSWNAGTGVLTLSGTATVADYETALRSVGYFNGSDDPSTLARTVSFVVSDGSLASVAATRSVAVSAVNDAPVNNVPLAGQSTAVGVALVFSGANGNALKLVDADAGAAPVQLTLAVTNGVLTLSGTAGLSFTSGDGSADASMRFSGTLAAINAALDGLRFDPTPAYSGGALLSLDTDDLGNSGSGGALLDSDQVVIAVVSSSNAPVLAGANDFPAIAEDAVGNTGTLVSALIAGQVSDADAGALTGIAVTAVDDSNGQWQYSLDDGALWTAFGTPSTTAARLLAADALTRVRFVPAADWNGSVAAGISLRAWDRSTGSAGGVADTTIANRTVRDEFTTVSYANNDGSAGWAAPWIDSDASASSGQITISGGRLNFAGSLLSSSTIHRQVDLSRASGATLSFDYTNALALATMKLEVSGNGGASYTTLASSFAGGSSSASFDLGAWLSVDTRIRFTIGGLLGGGSFSLDNLQIAWSEPLSGGKTAFSSAIASSGITVLPVNDPVLGLPTISGSAVEDSTLSGNAGGLSDVEGLGPFSWQWLRDGVAISGATASTLLLGDADVGRAISVRVSFVDGAGSAESATSAATAPVGNLNDAPAGLPTIGGSVVEDQTLTAVTSGITDDDGLGAFSYQWLRDGSAIIGATASTLLLGDADVGKAISVRVDWVDGNGTAETLTSAATAAVGNVNDVPVGLPTIGGTVTENQTLTAVTSGISDDDGLGAFSYQWLRNGSAISGATGSTLLLGDADVGQQISVRISYVDGRGTSESLTSAATAAVVNINDAPRGTDATLAVDRNGNQTLQRGDFGFSDTAGENDAFVSVLMQLPSAGTLRLGGSVISAPTEVTVAELDAGLLVYSPVVGGSGNAYATIAFQVRDDGGTADGGVDLDPTLRRLTIDIVNRAPVVVSHGGAANVALGVVENSSIVTSVAASDADGDAIVYSIAGGADAAHFRVDAATGVLSFRVPPNFEAPIDVGADNVYQVVVRASDGGQSADQAFAVTVSNISEALQNTGELLVNVTNPNAQETSMVNRGSHHAVAMAPNGDHVVVWSSHLQDGSGWGVYAQRFDKAGVALGSEFRVNQATAGDQVWATVGMDVSGRFVVSWTSANQDGTSQSVYARRFNADGSASSAEFRVNTTNTGSQSNSTVALDANGNFIVVWEGNGPGDSDGIFARRFAADGSAIDAVEFRINTDLTRGHRDASVSMNASGAFAVMWDNSNGVQMRRYDSAGVALGGQVNVTNESSAGNGSIALADDGSFVVVWRETQVGRAVVMQRFNSAGSTSGSNVVVNSTYSSDQTNPSVAIDGLGNFIVAWEGNGTGDSSGVFAQKYLANGTRVGGEFRLNITTSSEQSKVSLAMLDLDNFVAVWSGKGAADSDGIFMRQYGQLNSAPVLSGANPLATIAEDAVGNAGTLVSALIAGHLSDIDNPSALGIAVIGVDGSRGSWQYTTNGGSSWTAFGAVDASSARLLAANASTAVRFIPAADWNGSVGAGLVFHGWDQSSGSIGGTADVSSITGGTSAFSANSAASGINVTPVNDAPTGLPVISGSATEDQTLTADPGAIADVDGLGAFSYQWLRNGVAISGATGSSLLLGDADVGKAISVRVSYVDGGGTAESLTSAATAAVANVNDSPTGLPVLIGSAVEDQTLNVHIAGIADVDGLGAFSYQWLRNGVAISGATGSSLLLGDADVGKAISVRVSYVDGGGTAESLTSAPTAPVANVNDAPTGLPVINGSATEDQTLTVDLGTIADADGLGTFSYQWLRNGVAISGATGSSLLLGDADVGQAISVRVGYTDGHGTAESLTSAATAAVVNVNDAPTGLPVINGSATEDQTLTVDLGAIADADGLGAFSYQWLRNGVAISGATGSSLLLGDADVGQAISVRVGYTDGHGTTESLTSAATAAVVNVNDPPLLTDPLGDRRAIVGTNFSVTIPSSTFADVDAGDTLSLKVTLADGGQLPAWLVFDPATGKLSGTPARDDLGSLVLRVTATDGAGAAAFDEFALHVVLTNVAPVAGALADQSASQGSAFSYLVPAGSFSDADVGDMLSLQAGLVSGGALPVWLTFDQATHTFSGTPGNADVGELTIRVTATDLAGASAASEFVLRIANVNDAPSAQLAIGDQRVDQGSRFELIIAAGSFDDVDAGDVLQLSARLVSGGPLPAWLSFDPATATFSGTPGNDDVGQIAIRIVASDTAGASAHIDFKLSVVDINDAPRQAAALEGQRATEGVAFSHAIPAGSFFDIDAGDRLVYSATLASGAALPVWLSFDAATRIFSGTPGNGDIGNLAIRVTATDTAGAGVSGDFMLRVADVNDAPLLAGVHDLASIQQDDFSNPGTLVADLIAGKLADPDAAALSGIAVVAVDGSHGSWQYTTDGSNWMAFGQVDEESARLLAADATTAIRFVPAERWFGRVAEGLTLRAWDQSSGSAGQVADVRLNGGDSAFSRETASAGVTVVHVNHAPEAKPIADQTIVEARLMQFTLPPATFVDSDAGDTLSYRATLLNGAALPSWLSFDAQTLTFKGNPTKADIGSMTIRVIATDGAGAAAQSVFVLTVAQAPFTPLPAGPEDDQPPAAPADEAPAAEAEPEQQRAVQTSEPAAPTGASSGGSEMLAAAVIQDVGSASIVVNPVDPVGERSVTGSRSDAILATLPVAQFNVLTVSSGSQLLVSEDLLRKFDDLKHQMQDIGEQQRQMIANSLAISSGLSLGYVVWLVRGGVLLSSMLSALPAWQMIDPMPVLSAAGAAKSGRGKRWFGGADDREDREVEKLFDGQAPDSLPPVAPSGAPVAQATTPAAAAPTTEVRS